MVSSEEEPEIKPAATAEWDVDMEIQMFYAMANNKPVGVNKHFQIIRIWEKLSDSLTKDITIQDLWKHLGTLYDLSTLDETEPVPFPCEQINFSLPDSEFGTLLRSKDVVIKEPPGDESEDGGSASPKTSTPTPRSSSRGTASKDNTPKVGRKDSTATPATKSRKESGSSHASTDTPSIKSEKEFDRRRDSRDSNASGTRDSSASRKSLSQKDRSKSRVSSVQARESPLADDDSNRRGARRRAHTSTPPATAPPAKRRRH